MLPSTFVVRLLHRDFTAVLIVPIKSAVLAIPHAGVLFFAQYWFSDQIVLNAMNGRFVTAQEAPELRGWQTSSVRLPRCPSRPLRLPAATFDRFRDELKPPQRRRWATTGLP